MRSHKFLAGAVTGVALVVLVSGLFLAGVSRQPTSAASGTPVAKSPATDAATPGISKAEINALEQRMITAISDAEWSAAATTLGMTRADFDTAINAGQTVASLGAPHNVTADQVHTAMVAAGTATVSAAEQNGTITQADADFLDQGLVTAIADKVTHANIDDAAAGAGTPAAGEQALDAQKKAGAQLANDVDNAISKAELSAMAPALGVSADELDAALRSGPSDFAALANAHHVTAQQLEDALVAAGEQALDQAVASGTVSSSDADSLRTGHVQLMAQKLSHMVDAPATATPTP